MHRDEDPLGQEQMGCPFLCAFSSDRRTRRVRFVLPRSNPNCEGRALLEMLNYRCASHQRVHEDNRSLNCARIRRRRL
jgi:hypothetical protein